MESLFQSVNETLREIKTDDDVFTIASYAHLEFLIIHPFGDGNGRTARLLHNLLLLNKSLPLLVIDSSKKGKYIEAIKTSREAGSIDVFNEFFKTEYIAYWRNELNTFKKKTLDKSNGSSFNLVL